MASRFWCFRVHRPYFQAEQKKRVQPRNKAALDLTHPLLRHSEEIHEQHFTRLSFVPCFFVNEHTKRVKCSKPVQPILRGGTTTSHSGRPPGTLKSARTCEISSNTTPRNASQVVCATLGMSCYFSVSAFEPPLIRTDTSPLQPHLLHHECEK